MEGIVDFSTFISHKFIQLYILQMSRRPGILTSSCIFDNRHVVDMRDGVGKPVR